jgi:putative transposase
MEGLMQRLSVQKLFNKAFGKNGSPIVIHMVKSGTNKMDIRSVNKSAILIQKIKIRQCKCLNNVVEQGHRNISRRVVTATGFKRFESAQRTLSGIEVVSVIRKNQIEDSKSSTYKAFFSLAA